MKKLITTALISTAIVGSVSFTTPAKADDLYVLATSLCEYTKANDRNEIRKRLKKSRVKLRNVYDAIECNGQKLYQFAEANNATDVMAYYKKKVKSKI